MNNFLLLKGEEGRWLIRMGDLVEKGGFLDYLRYFTMFEPYFFKQIFA